MKLSAQERLLSEANKIIQANTPTEKEIADRLRSVGFVSTPVVKKSETKTKALVESKEQANLINYCKQSYPFLKFITEDELNRICEKYNLIHAPVGNYINDVPEKNLRDIERAQALKSNDIEQSYIEAYYTMYEWFSSINQSQYVTPSEAKNWQNPIRVDTVNDFDLRRVLKEKYKPSKHVATESVIFTEVNKTGLFIAAPSSHFNIDGLKKKSKHGFFNVFETEVKDPIVFRYVKGGCQILTMWGLEASDPSLVNPVNN